MGKRGPDLKPRNVDREAISEWRKLWWSKQPRKVTPYSSMSAGDYNRWKRYKITPEQFEQMWEDQKGLCKICGKVMERRAGGHSTDHDHETLIVRGLLCRNCNGCMGWYDKWYRQVHTYSNK